MAFACVAVGQQLVLAGLQRFGDGGCLPKVREKGKKSVCYVEVTQGCFAPTGGLDNLEALSCCLCCF